HHDAAELEKFLDFKEDKNIKTKLEDIKQHNKRKLQRHLAKSQGVAVNPDSIFDVQIKRIHEYKRQQMNVLYVIYKYLDIKAGNIPARP
ncbi:glycogen/starch/alpha-glucan phosphorylase, partial [Streptococcus pyogenes]